MTKVTPSSEVSSLLQSIDSDLAQPVKKGEATAIQKAVKQLPDNATVTLGAMEQLGFSPALRGNLVFEMFARKHPDLVKPHLRSAEQLEGVFRSLSGQDAYGTDWRENAEIDEELATFVKALLEQDRENVNTGVESEGSVIAIRDNELQLGAVGDETIAIRAGEFTLHIIREQNEDIVNWRYVWNKDKEEPAPLATLSLRSLERVYDHLFSNASEGAANPLLALARNALNEREGNLVEGAVSELEKMIAKKKSARAEHLAAVDACLRIALGDKAVGRAEQGDVNQLAERALGTQG